MKQEIITINPYGAYEFEFKIKVDVIEKIITEQKTIEYSATCSCIVDKDDYNEESKEYLITGMRKYCADLIILKKMNYNL